MLLFQNIIDSQYHYQPSWVMGLIILSVMMIGYLFSAFHSRFIAVIRSFFTMRYASQLAREEHSLTHPASIFLSINFIISCSLFILQVVSSSVFSRAGIEMSFIDFFIMLAGISAMYFVKIIVIKISGFIFAKQIIAAEYIFIIFLVNQIIGIVLVPIIIFIAYGNEPFRNSFIYAGIFLLAIAFIIRVGKGVLAVLSSGAITPFYLFLYLCALEILPLLLGYKLLEKLV